jgi:hypothetical protein
MAAELARAVFDLEAMGCTESKVNVNRRKGEAAGNGFLNL